MRILVIGGTGFMGRHLINLLEDEHELYLFHRGINQAHSGPNSIIGDRDNLPQFIHTFDKLNLDVVVDLIAYTEQHAKDLITVCRNITNHLIVISSGDVYLAYDVFRKNHHEKVEGELDENANLRQQLYPYRGLDTSNRLWEQYEKILVESTIMSCEDVHSTILRMPALFGEYDMQRKLLEYIAPMLDQNKEIVMAHDKLNWRWTRGYVKNAVKAIDLCIKNKQIASGQIFNVGQSDTLCERDIIDHLQKITRWEGKINAKSNASDQYNYQQHLVLNTDKIRAKLGYGEEISFQAALAQTVEYVKGLPSA